MYLQITTRCNMSCAHCCFACTADGEDMSLATFREALAMGEDAHLTLGGGEPTLHKDWDTMLLESLGNTSGPYDDGSLFIATNGSITKRALVLAKLAKSKVLEAQLSRDEYHDEIDQSVVDAFENIESEDRYSRSPHLGVRNTTMYSEPKPYGRAIELLCLDEDEDAHERDGTDCMCSTTFVKPNGDIHQCGCPDSPKIGHTSTGYDSPQEDECCKSSYFINSCLEPEHKGKYEHLLV